MILAKNLRTRIKRKLRSQHLKGTAKRPRVAVFRSSRYLYAQMIDDDKKLTILGLSDKQVSKKTNKIERAFELGEKLALDAIQKNIKSIVFDRSGYTYHGRIQSLADGMRKGGLQF